MARAVFSIHTAGGKRPCSRRVANHKLTTESETMKTNVSIIGSIVVVAANAALCPAQLQDLQGRGKPVTVMTRNLYVGADFSPIVLALYQGNLPQVPGLVSTAYAQIVASDFPARAKAIAA